MSAFADTRTFAIFSNACCSDFKCSRTVNIEIHMHVCVCVCVYGKYQNQKINGEVSIYMDACAFTHGTQIH